MEQRVAPWYSIRCGGIVFLAMPRVYAVRSGVQPLWKSNGTTTRMHVPVDGVWGQRWYVLNNVGLDAGYRYMLNLHQLNDRSGFTIKISKVFGWSKN
jgi:hypothetical protein